MRIQASTLHPRGFAACPCPALSLLTNAVPSRTVDLDGALNDPRKVAKFSGELWERLNGGTKGAHGEAQVAGESL